MKTLPAAMLLLPAGGVFILSFLAPLVMAGRLSFFQSNYITEHWVGLGNYAEAFRDGTFVQSIVNVLAFVALIVPPTLLASYGMTVLIESVGKRAQAFGRFSFYIPTMAAGLIISIVWKWIFSRGGLADSLAGTTVGWLSQVWPARVAITFGVVTTALGQYVIMFSAVMKSIAKELKDAAAIDGAGGWHYQLRIVLPLMTPTVLLIILLSILGTMQMWETVYWMTGGGPGGRTATPIYDIYLTAFNFSHHGLAAAKSIIVLAIIAGFIAVKRRVETWAL